MKYKEQSQQPIEGAAGYVETAPEFAGTAWGNKGEFVHDTGISNLWYFQMRTGPAQSEGQQCNTDVIMIMLYEYTKIYGQPQYRGDCDTIPGTHERRIWKLDLLTNDEQPGSAGEVVKGYRGSFEFDDDELEWMWKMHTPIPIPEKKASKQKKCYSILLTNLAVAPEYIGHVEGQTMDEYRIWRVTPKV